MVWLRDRVRALSQSLTAFLFLLAVACAVTGPPLIYLVKKLGTRTPYVEPSASIDAKI